GMKPGLERVFRLLDRLGSPQEHECLVVHIAGTNGKGTVASVVASMFQAAGKRTGLYTSPHLISFRERIRVDGQMISGDDVASLVSLMKEGIEQEQATFFEATTALAFEYFRRQQVEVMVLETGMGGRLDATNVTRPRYVVIPSISRDHTRWLGDTIQGIAAEKAAVIKPGTEVYTAVEDSEALGPIMKRTDETGAVLHQLCDEVSIELEGHSLGSLQFTLTTPGRVYHSLVAPLTGLFHISNLALAVLVAEHAGLTDTEIREGLRLMRRTGYRARLEVISRDPCTIVLDVSHNAAGIERSIDALLEVCSSTGNRCVVLGLADDKDATGIAGHLARFADEVLTVNLPVERSMDAERLAEACRSHGIAASGRTSVCEALDEARGKAGPGGIVLVTGSFYLAGEVVRIDMPGGAP
ncbi:MAG TPA: bifunctional folylpolyglutamate synthase/dihydrofolate synthase, partial [Prosthecochloris aestuarii]|nr:bifunctional folylpolyglutamate synthase/dihydrofolate synthase [Prosthecochloris aestuarii]